MEMKERLEGVEKGSLTLADTSARTCLNYGAVDLLSAVLPAITEQGVFLQHHLPWHGEHRDEA